MKVKKRFIIDCSVREAVTLSHSILSCMKSHVHVESVNLVGVRNATQLKLMKRHKCVYTCLYYFKLPFHALFTSTRCRSCTPPDQNDQVPYHSERLQGDPSQTEWMPPSRSSCHQQLQSLTEFPRIKGVVKRILVSKLPVKDKCQWIVQTHRHIFSLEAQADCGRLHDVFHVTDIVPCQCMLFMLLMGCINIHARDAIALYFAPAWMWNDGQYAKSVCWTAEVIFVIHI